MSITTLKVINDLIMLLNVFTNKYNKDLFLLMFRFGLVDSIGRHPCVFTSVNHVIRNSIK